MRAEKTPPSTIQEAYSATELAAVAAAGYPASERRMRARLDREQVPCRDVDCQGGKNGKRREYLTASLPPALREAIASRAIGQAAAPNDRSVPTIPAPAAIAITTPAAELRTWQRECMDARAALLAEVKRIGAEVGMERAVRAVVNLACEGRLPEHLQRLVPVANARAGDEGKRALSRGSVYRWLGEAKQGISAAAPKPSRLEAQIPAWLPQLLAIYQRPTKPSLAFALEELAKQNQDIGAAPSQSAARRWLARISPVDLARGRMGARELKTIRPFVRRDSSHMWPGDCYTADGHTFDAEVAHPAHGRPFRPEITGVLDIATRRCVGWSAGLAESTWAVLDAQRHAIERCGIPALWYVDRGSGYRNAMQADLVVGFAARIGMTITHSLPYNSQARGVMERSHQSLWVRAAKLLPTYMGAPMDREAKQKAFKLTRADIKTAGASRLLMPWSDFLAFCQAVVDAYNERPHRSLARVRDASTGKMRHLTPNEAWQQAIDEGWSPATVTAEESTDLFRPYRICSVVRAEVRLYNNTYFHRALEHHHGDKVQVGYDIHDPSRVWVRDEAGRLLCVAEFGANRRQYFAQSVIDQAAETRARGRIKRATARIEEAQAELDPPALIEHQPAAVIAADQFRRASNLIPISPDIDADIDPDMARLEAEFAAPRKVNVHELRNDHDKHAHWLQLDARRGAGEALDPADENFFHAWQQDAYFRFRIEGEAEFEQMVAKRAAQG